MEWCNVLADVINALLPYIITAFTGFIAWLGIQIKNKYNEKVNNEKIEKVVNEAVKYVEQKFKDFSGEQKYELAVDKAVKILRSKGIKVTADEIEMLIESTVLTLTSSVKKEGE